MPITFDDWKKRQEEEEEDPSNPQPKPKTEASPFDQWKANRAGKGKEQLAKAAPKPEAKSDVFGPTREELEKEAARIAKAAPTKKDAAKAKEIVKPSKPTFLSRALGVVQAPLASVTGQLDDALKGKANPAQVLLGPIASKGARENVLKSLKGEKPKLTGEILEEHFPGGGTGAKWGKRIGGFIGDVGLDPVTYITAGTGTIGKTAAKSAAVSALEKGAAKGALSKEAAEIATKHIAGPTARSTAVRKLAKEAPEAEKFLRKASPDVLGGVRLRAPLSSKTVPIIPGRMTSKVSSRIAEPIHKVTRPIADKLTPLSMLGRSPEGMKARGLWHEAEATSHGLQQEGQDVARQMKRAFRGVSDDEAAVIIEQGGGTKAQQAAAQAFRNFRDNAWATAKETFPLAKREEGILPRVFTPEFLSRRSGEPGGVSRGIDTMLDTIGGHGRERGLGEMSLDEAEQFMRSKYGLGDDVAVYERNPVTAVSRYALEMPERLKVQRFGEGLRDKSLLSERAAVREMPEEAAQTAQALRDAATKARLGHSSSMADITKAAARGEPVGDLMKAESAARSAMKQAEEALTREKPVGHIPEGWASLGQSKYVAPKDITEFIGTEMLPKANRLPGWSAATKAFKFGVTVPWPAFHARNFYGSQSVNAARIPGYIKELVRTARLARGKPTRGLVRDLERHGLTPDDALKMLRTEPVVGGDVSQLAEIAGKVGSRGERVGRAIGKYSGGRKMMGATERAARAPSFLHALAKTGDPEAARQFTSMLHGNYGELSPTARDIRDVGIPFFKWMQTNVPQQIGLMAQAPGRAVRPLKLMQNLEDPEARAAYERNNLLTPGQTEQTGFVPGGDTMVTANLPLHDLNQYLHPSGAPNPRAVLASTHPIIKGVIETVTKKRLFGRGEIRDWESARGLEPQLATALEKIPGAKGTLVRRGAGGELFISKQLKAALGATPTSRVSSSAGVIGGEQDWQEKLASLLSGVRIEEPSELGQSLERYSRGKELEEFDNSLFRMGYKTR